jgi:hypothetical protein
MVTLSTALRQISQPLEVIPMKFYLACVGIVLPIIFASGPVSAAGYAPIPNTDGQEPDDPDVAFPKVDSITLNRIYENAIKAQERHPGSCIVKVSGTPPRTLNRANKIVNRVLLELRLKDGTALKSDVALESGIPSSNDRDVSDSDDGGQIKRKLKALLCKTKQEEHPSTERSRPSEGAPEIER